ncbi:MAG TPA: DnaB-like helicase C-terminal domain-containing protein [Flavobacteriaceae bacterium]|nr:DnaB-like helicase C-terminal domain-containing protein [Flavobacteriaceae bacterium]
MSNDLKDKIGKIFSENPTADENEILSLLKQFLFGSDVQSGRIRASQSMVDLVAESLIRINSDTNSSLINSGFKNFDEHFGGFGLGELAVVGGRPGMGKTQLLANLSLNISTTFPVLFFTFGLSAYVLSCRFLSALSGIAVKNILHQDLTEDEKNKLSSVEKTIHKHKIFINESGHNSIPDFKGLCQKHIEENGVKVVIVDDLQMMSSEKHSKNRVLEVGVISRALKSIAKDYDVSVIASSQLSRAVESRHISKHPQLSDLRDSGAIEQNADKVIFMYRPEYYGREDAEIDQFSEGIVELIVAKNRNGALGTVKLLRDNNFTTFRSFDESEAGFAFLPGRLAELSEKKSGY